MAYPDWVLKHKKKGTYINKVGNNYYLYAAHSEHIPGTANKARRVCDGYLGRITEKDGFIPKKKKESPLSLEYGLSCAIVSLVRYLFFASNKIILLCRTKSSFALSFFLYMAKTHLGFNTYLSFLRSFLILFGVMNK